MATKQKSYLIKVPVYCTEMIVKEHGAIFGAVSYSEMIKYLKNKIENFKVSKRPLEFENRNKTRKTVINEIDYTEHKSGEIDSLLLRISAYGTNLYDGYLEADEKINFKRSHKVGSDTNFALVYPVITGIDKQNYTRYFIVLVYEDPTKNNEEIVRIVKRVLNQILNIPIANIKLPTILEELKEIGVIPELQMRYSAIHNHENDVDVKYIEYQTGGKLIKKKEDYFKNMPVDKIGELLNEPPEEDYQKKEARLKIGKKEYRITKEQLNEASEALTETAEKIFNATTTITQEELDQKVHDTEFIFSKLESILSNYLSSDNEN